MHLIQGRSGDGDTVGSTLRLPKALRDSLKIQASRSGRSYNTHVVMLLANALDRNEEDRQGGYPDGLL